MERFPWCPKWKKAKSDPVGSHISSEPVCFSFQQFHKILSFHFLSLVQTPNWSPGPRVSLSSSFFPVNRNECLKRSLFPDLLNARGRVSSNRSITMTGGRLGACFHVLGLREIRLEGEFHPDQLFDLTPLSLSFSIWKVVIGWLWEWNEIYYYYRYFYF